MSDASEIRQWARDRGLEVGERGRLAPDLVAAYEQAHAAAPQQRKPGRPMPRVVKAKQHWDWQRREASR